ncbi:MAG: hypothetical protein IPL91_08295 [Hyphomicrobium sp.]|nr:hypothetical protein [Hyphomicrobium sp.]
MRRFPTALLIASGFLLSAAHLSAEPAPQSNGRYTMTPIEGGFIRLDSETGAVARCTGKDDNWTCEPVKDGTAVAQDRAKLEDENKALKEQLKKLEGATPPAADATPPSGSPTEPPGGAVSQLPTEEEIDKAFDYVERMYKKLRDRIQKLEQPAPTPTPEPKTGDGGSGAL